MASDAGATLFDYLKIKFRIDTACKLACSIPSMTWKDYKKQWVVLTEHISPPQCFLVYCQQEDNWLMNQPSLPKLALDDFKLIRHGTMGMGAAGNGVPNTGSMRSNVASTRNILEIQFEHYTLFIEYESMTKLQLWYDHFEKIQSRTFAELVRCPEHPEREQECVLEVCAEKIYAFNPHLVDTKNSKAEFEWRLDNIRRVKYHKHVGKVEVEVGRAAMTGEGHFYFIGPQIKQFFTLIKERIEELDKIASLKNRGKELPPRTSTFTSELNQTVTVKPTSPPPKNPSRFLSSSNEEGVEEEECSDSPESSGDQHPRTYRLQPPPPPPLPLKQYETMRSPLAAAAGATAHHPSVTRDDYCNSSSGVYQKLQLSNRQRPMNYDRITKSTSGTFQYVNAAAAGVASQIVDRNSSSSSHPNDLV